MRRHFSGAIRLTFCAGPWPSNTCSAAPSASKTGGNGPESGAFVAGRVFSHPQPLHVRPEAPQLMCPLGQRWGVPQLAHHCAAQISLLRHPHMQMAPVYTSKCMILWSSVLGSGLLGLPLSGGVSAAPVPRLVTEPGFRCT